MKFVEFYCKSCGFKGQEQKFGSGVVCPECKSRDVVVASLWNQFKSKPAAQTSADTCSG